MRPYIFYGGMIGMARAHGMRPYVLGMSNI